MEIKDIIGYEDKYAISSDGRVFSKISNRFLNSVRKTPWYIQVSFTKNGKRVPFRIHRLVAEAFLPRIEGLNEVNHKNGIKGDNRLENLEWTNRKKNIQHSYTVLKRKSSEGATHPKSKLLLDLETGVYYDSVKYAAEAKQLTRHQIKSGIRSKGIYRSLIYA